MFRYRHRERRLRSRIGERQLHRNVTSLPDGVQEIIYSIYSLGIKARNLARSRIKRWAFFFKRRQLRRSGVRHGGMLDLDVGWAIDRYLWEVEVEDDEI